MPSHCTNILSFPLLFLCLLISSGIEAQSAAEIDWVERDLTEDELEITPFSCPGYYASPPLPNQEFWEDPENEGSFTVNYDKGSTTLKGDKAVYEGSVSVEGKGYLLTSSRMELDRKSNFALMDGPIALREEGILVAGERASSDLSQGEATIDNASFLVHESGIRGSAEAIVRDSKKHLIISKGEFTRCEPGNNIWSMHGGKIRLKPETGFGSATNVILKIKGVPVVYIPYIRFPIDDQRHTGILMPTLSWDKEAATDFSLPVYFNLAPSWDATWTPRSLWRRGISHGLQMRFITRQTSNEINGALLNEDKLYDEDILVDQTSGGTTADSKLLDRWFVSFHHSGGTSRRLKSKLIYNAVSDPDYIDDIGGDFGSGTIDHYMNAIDSALSNRRTPVLERYGELDYRGNNWNLKLSARGFQNLNPNTQESYETLPQLQYNHRYSGELLNLNSRIELTRFDKDNALLTGSQKIVGDRGVASLSLSMPLRSSWGFLIPSITSVHRSYKLDDIPFGYEKNLSQSVSGASLDMGLYFDKRINRQTGNLIQTLEPRLFYVYVQEKDQSLIPLFDARSMTNSQSQLFRSNRFSGWDRIGDEKRISLGITNRLIREESGSEILRFDIGQAYYLKDQTVVLPPFLPGVDHTASYSPIFSDLTLSFSPNWSLRGSLQWEPSSGVTNKGSLSVKYLSDLNHILNISYRYTNSEVEKLGNFESIEESDINFVWPIKGKWSVIGKWNYGWDKKQTIESFFGLEYNDCCWRSRLVVRRYLKTPLWITYRIDDPGSPLGYQDLQTLDNRADTGIFLEFQLKGLGTTGGRLSSLLEQAIPGYRKREAQIK